MSTPFDWLGSELRRLDETSLRRERGSSHPLPNGKILRNGKELWNFSGNDYLGLAGDARLIEASHQAAIKYGVGARASALVSGRTPVHVELEECVARFKKTEAALLFPTGFAANVGTICSLVESEDIVFCDRLNHASLIDGCRLSKSRLRIYKHCDLNSLETELKKAGEYRRKLIVTDALFSMDGDLAKLPEMVQLAEQYGAMLLVDEAHATGVFGESGAGLGEASGIESSCLVSVGTFSKAVGAQGGFVVGSRDLISWIWNRARPQMFSTALAPPLCGAIIAALEIIQQEPERRDWIQKQSHSVQQTLLSQGWNIPNDVRGPIIPIQIGDTEQTLLLTQQLQNLGILAAGIRPPTVPNGTSRIRLSLSYSHQQAGIEGLLKAFGSLNN